MPNPVVHFEVLGHDYATLTKFYGDVFGWELQDVMPGAYSMVAPGSEGAIPGGVGVAPEGPGHVTFYVEVGDLDAALEDVKSNGGSVVQEPMEIPDGPSIALFADPEGHVIGLVKGM